MSPFMADSTADGILVFSVLAWIASILVPAFGMLLQFPVIAYLTWKADIKGIPALLMLMLGRLNIRFFDMAGDVALRLGIAISPVIVFLLVAIIVMVKDLIARRYQGGSIAFLILWIPAIIPAAMMSIEAKRNGLSGYWSAPILDFLIPSVYFWGLSVSRSYEYGRDYFAKRLLIVLVAIETLQLVRVVSLFTFSASGLILSLFFYFVRDGRKVGIEGWKSFALTGIVVSLLLLIFGRKIDLITVHGASAVASADQYGSTFSRMGVYALVIVFVVWFKRQLSLNQLLPILIVVANLSLVSYVISTQENASAKHDVVFQYETLEERFNAKLFGDRAGVWTMGWEEVKTPPYFIKDLRSFLVLTDRGYHFRLLPHNQFLTLLGRHGWWLGLTLALFIIWVWFRAMKAIYYCMYDPLLYTVFIPTGLAIYAVVGTTGQSVVGSGLWANSLTCIIMPAIIYGVWQERRKMGYRG